MLLVCRKGKPGEGEIYKLGSRENCRDVGGSTGRV